MLLSLPQTPNLDNYHIDIHDHRRKNKSEIYFWTQKNNGDELWRMFDISNGSIFTNIFVGQFICAQSVAKRNNRGHVQVQLQYRYVSKSLFRDTALNIVSLQSRWKIPESHSVHREVDWYYSLTCVACPSQSFHYFPLPGISLWIPCLAVDGPSLSFDDESLWRMRNVSKHMANCVQFELALNRTQFIELICMQGTPETISSFHVRCTH